MKKIFKVSLVVLSFTFIFGATKCGLNTEPVETTVQADGYQYCVFGPFSDLTKDGTRCDELREYPLQVDNSLLSRFEFQRYIARPNVSGSLIGKWLIIDKINTSSPAHELRQTCNILQGEDGPNSYAINCDAYADSLIKQFTYDQANQKVTTPTLTGFQGGEQEQVRRTVYYEGLVTDQNKIHFDGFGEIENMNTGEITHRTFVPFQMIRLGVVGADIGTFTVKKVSFDGDTIIEKSHLISDFYEEYHQEVPQKNSMKLFSSNQVEPVFTYKPYGFYSQGNPKVSFFEMDNFLDINQEYPENTRKILKLRYFNQIENSSDEVLIDFLINRQQSTRFERPDTIGNIRIKFSDE